jgi:hypothetical protein
MVSQQSRNVGQDGLPGKDNLELLSCENPADVFGKSRQPDLRLAHNFRGQPARGQPASRLVRWIATFRRIVSARLGLAQGEFLALSAIGPGRAWFLSAPASNRPIKGERTTEAAIQPPNRTASDIALLPKARQWGDRKELSLTTD